MVAIAGLLVIGIPFIGKLGIARGDRRRRGRRLGADDPADHDRRARALAEAEEARARAAVAARFERWGEIVTARPWLSIAAGVLDPARSSPRRSRSCGSASPTTATSPSRKTQRVAYDQLSEAFGPGSNGPFLLAVDIPKGARGQRGAARRAPEGRRGHAGHGQRRARRSPARTARWRRSSPIPKTAPQDAAHERPARAPARGRDPGGRRGHAAEGLRRRQHGRASRTSRTRSPRACRCSSRS